jgi:transaldolase/glucose-6-phosphate isomerase
MNSVKALLQHGQAVWLDYLSRGFIRRGELKALAEQDAVRGVTSNPSIFEKAIGHSEEYDEAIAALLRAGDRRVGELYETLAVEDIKHAADALRPTFDATRNGDGYVSIEVSPYLAHDTRSTIAEAKRLWREVGRSNLMIKVPATREGLPAIQALIAEGINVNITLLFSQQMYEQVVEAYLSGLEQRASSGGELAHVVSVASFFVSRIDTAVDKQLDEKIAKAGEPDEKARLGNLGGKVAIANAKLAYQRYKRLFCGERWNKLEAHRATKQRLLWASTGTKNKSYSDVLYVEELIGPNTINTMPPATLEAFRDHGKLRDSLEEDIAQAQFIVGELGRVGISLDAITEQLTGDGVRLFCDAADRLLGAVSRKRAALLGEHINMQTAAFAPQFSNRVEQVAEQWRVAGNVRRLYQRDQSLWTNTDENQWLGWLDSTEQEIERAGEYEALARQVKSEGFTAAVLLGMGGSSLGPEVLARTLGHDKASPRLHVLDTTDPSQIKATEAAVDLATTMFIVSSKSGGTTEPNILKDYFYQRVVDAVGNDRAGKHFFAVTDAGSPLEKTAKAGGFHQTFLGTPSVGGRYSVLSPFGLVPAAATGIDVGHFLKTAQAMVFSCGADVPPADNPGVQLGIALGISGHEGRDKVTILASPRLSDFGAWAEQLIAESTGKNGKGLIPVDGEPVAGPDVYGDDRFFVDLRIKGEMGAEHDARLDALASRGHPVVRIELPSAEHIGQEFFRFEIAIAVAGALLGINPFDQPDVEASKTRTRELIGAFEKTGNLPSERPVISGNCFDLYTDAANAAALRQAGAGDSVESWIGAHLSRIHPGDYAAVLAYLARNQAHADILQTLRLAVRDRIHVATCVGFGPRFLHSTGQAYKGGANSGVFLQITGDDADDLAIPGHRASFGVVKAAQARGDFDVLAKRRRRVLRAHIKGNVETGLAMLADSVTRAMA